MRSIPAIGALFPAVRSAILAALVLHPNRECYFRDLAKDIEVPPSSLTRELKSLTAAGILQRRRDGNRVYYRADPACPILPELRGLLLKTAGLVDVLREALMGVADKIDCAFVYGSIARGKETAESDIDVVVVGRTGRYALAESMQSAERRLGRPINVSVYKPAEFAKKAASDDHFIRSVLKSEKLFVAGDAHDLERAGKRETRRSGADE